MEYESDKINESNASGDQNNRWGATNFALAKESRFGAGTAVVRNNKQGWFVGSNVFSTAPLGTDYNGNFFANSANITGNIFATGGIIEGDLVITGSFLSDDGTGRQVKIASGKVSFLKSGSEKAYLKTSSDNASIDVATGIYFYVTKTNGSPILRVDQNSNINFSTDSQLHWSSGRSITATASQIQFDGELQANSNLKFTGDTYIRWGSGRSINATGSSLEIDGDLVPNSNYGVDCGSSSKKWHNVRAQYILADSYFSCAGDGGQGFSDEIITSVYWDSGANALKIRTRVYTFKGGICTGRGSENTRTVHNF